MWLLMFLVLVGNHVASGACLCYGLYQEHLQLVRCAGSPATHVQDISSPSFLGGYAKGIVELPGSMKDSHARVSKVTKDGADERGDAAEDEDASPSPSLLSTSGAGAESPIAPLNGDGNDSVDRVSPEEESPPTFAETRIREAGGVEKQPCMSENA